MITWETIYNTFGIRDFIYYISSPSLQDALFPLKMIFILFTIFFLCAVFWFYFNSTYVKYHFAQGAKDFFSFEPFGLREMNKRWDKIMRRTDSGLEPDYKLAIIDADDFLYQTLEDRGYQGETFEELLNNASKKIIVSMEDILEAHSIRNSIVYDPDYTLLIDRAKIILSNYEKAIKSA